MCSTGAILCGLFCKVCSVIFSRNGYAKDAPAECEEAGRRARASRSAGLARFPNRPVLEALEPRLLFSAVPVITEFLASNDSVFFDEDGDSSDWLEIFNAGDSALDLTGWYLTDDAGDLSQWAFPSVSLDSGEFLVVFASGKDRADADGTELHTNFRLGAGGEYLGLVESDGTTVAFEFAPEYPAQQTDVSYGFTATTTATQTLVDDATPLTYLLPPDGSLGTTWTQAGFDDSAWTAGALGTGIGYENNPGQSTSYDSLIDTALPSGTTSAYTRFEFNVADPSALNRLTFRAIYDDGFVAYLNGTPVESQNAPGSPAFNSAAIGGRGDDAVLDGYVDFDISEHAGLLQSGSNVLAVHALNQSGSSDMLFIPELVAETITVNTNDPGFFFTPTPGLHNGESLDGFVGDTAFSVDRGFFDTAFDVIITTPDTPDALVVYTLDGSAPTVDSGLTITNGVEYTGPINISSTTNLRAAGFKLGFEPTNIDTQTYIFLDDVAQQTAASQEAALTQGLPSNAGNGVDFGLDPAILSGFSSQAFEDSLLSIPTISLTLDNASFLGANGIYTNPTQRGRASEREVSAEWITPDGTSSFQVDAGIRIQGAASRILADKYSFRLTFRGEYGAPELDFPLFGDGVNEFDNIVLRSVFNDGYGWQGDDSNLREQLYVRDLWFRETQAAMGHPSARGNWAHLYINGQYWGLYHPSERPDADYAAETLGGDNDNYDAINHGGVIDDASENNPNDNTSATQIYATAIGLANAVNSASGDAAKWEAFQRLQGNFSDGQDDPNQEDFLDVENYIDYIILNLWGGNDDWPNNNWFTNRLRGPDSEGFRFYAWDSELSLGLSTRTDVNENFTGVSTGAAEFYGILRNYEEFRIQFGDQVHRHVFNDGALAGSNPADRFNALAQPIRAAIIGESARWGDQHFSNNPLTQAEWDSALDDILNEYFAQRSGIALNQFRSAGLYSSVDAVTWNLRGGAVAPDFDIALSAPAGTIYYTLDGSDPRQVGGGVSSSAIEYTGPINLANTSTIRARALNNGVWSAIDQADFTSTVPTPEQEYLRVAELHYNPTGATAAEQAAGFTDGDQFEFIELINTSTTDTIDLAGVSFVNGVNVTLGAPQPLTPVLLAPGERALLVSDLAAFTERYGQSVVDNSAYVTQYAGRLDNGGERLTLQDAFGNTIQSFKYEDGNDEGEEAWPTEPDGDGPSLVIVDTAGDYDDGANWAVSRTANGTPGEDEVPRLVGDLDHNGEVDVFDIIAAFDAFALSQSGQPFDPNADLDNNGEVDVFDIIAFFDAFALSQNGGAASLAALQQPAATPAEPVQEAEPQEQASLVQAEARSTPVEAQPVEPVVGFVEEEATDPQTPQPVVLAATAPPSDRALIEPVASEPTVELLEEPGQADPVAEEQSREEAGVMMALVLVAQPRTRSLPTASASRHPALVSQQHGLRYVPKAFSYGSSDSDPFDTDDDEDEPGSLRTGTNKRTYF